MLAERPKIEAAIQAVCSREEFTVARMPASEVGFLEALLEHGVIKPELLTADAGLADVIRRQPMLEWKARHAR